MTILKPERVKCFYCPVKYFHESTRTLCTNTLGNFKLMGSTLHLKKG